MQAIYPIENYKKLAMAIVRTAAEDYIGAKKKLPRLEKKLEARRKRGHGKDSKSKEIEAKIMQYKRDINEAELFFLSDRFDIYMPNVDGELFLYELKKKAAREMECEQISRSERHPMLKSTK